MGEEGSSTSKAKSWSNTPLCVAGGEQDMEVVFTTRRRRRVTVIEGTDIMLAYQLPGKPAEVGTLHHPSDKLSYWK